MARTDGDTWDLASSVGATATIYFETEDGREIRVQKAHEDLADLSLAIGKPFHLSWSPADGHLVSE